MSSEHGGLVKSRAETFARRLETRLRSLTESEDSGSWPASDTEVFYDLDSPEEELAEPIFVANRGNLALQRSESDSSQYYDTVESVDQLPPSPASPLTLRKIPILHLRSDGPSALANGHAEPLDADTGCSRVLEMSPQEENNNTGHDEADVDSYGIFSCEISTLEDEKPQAEEAESSAFCVLCDIEQIKSSLSNGCSKEIVEVTEREDRLKNINNELPSSGASLENEEKIALTDLLQVLKLEIVSENEETTQTECPNIEVRESSPEGTQSKKSEEDEDDDIETKRKHFRRCSSLKSGKTPPGTPGRKKIVRFADVLGLDLADVKTFLDEVPTVPKSAFEDLHGIEMSSSPVVDSPITSVTVVIPQPDKLLVPLFQQPSAQPNFLDRVLEHGVCLEHAVVTDPSLFAISGVVRVKNVDFHKSVYVRYSINDWGSFSDLQARYVPGSCDGFSDRFSFMLYAHTLAVGQRLQFAVRFHAAGAQFWDSNGGANYVFECRGTPRTCAGPPALGEPCASFY